MSEVYKVKVSQNDHLYSIALKYNTSPSFLQEINDLYPPIFERNTEIIIKNAYEMAKCNHTFRVQLSLPDSEAFGFLTYYEDKIIFEQKQSTIGGEKLVYPIKLSNVPKMNIIPHPSINTENLNDPSQPSLLIMSYFPNVADKSIVDVVIFNAPKAELNALYQFIKLYQKNNHHLKFTNEKVQTQNLRVAELKSADTLSEDLSPLPLLLTNLNIKENEFLVHKSNILDDIDAFPLRRELPSRFRSYLWFKVFTLSEDGTSYSTLYNKCKDSKSCILLIKALDGSKIGCFLPTGLQNRERVYGTGDTFVFQYNPDFKVYKWSRANETFTYSTKKYIMIGTGGGSAIWIDNCMKYGRSDMCETFNSPPLTTKSDFEIIDMEVYELASYHHE